MIAEAHSRPGPSAVAVIEIGNTRIALGIWEDCRVTHARRVTTADEAAFGTAFKELCGMFDGGRPPAVVVGSVVPEVLTQVVTQVDRRVGLRVQVVGADLPLPIPVSIRSARTVGVDRICSAAAAFEKTRQACTVIDFGTAVTVDLVGDAGEFLGGAILPGARMQARALHEHTAGLPEVEVEFPAAAVGDDTRSAIRSGVCHGIVGAVRGLVEGYATAVGKWPQVVATGGDLELFAPHCDFLDSRAPELCLMGVGLAFAKPKPKPRT
jgi:type III pantothenate kinase